MSVCVRLVADARACFKKSSCTERGDVNLIDANASEKELNVI
jgi:hypothetical protein